MNFPLILAATGLGDINTAALTVRTGPEGLTGQVFISVPEANRRGLIKAFAVEPRIPPRPRSCRRTP